MSKYHTVLGIKPEASKSEIKQAYRKLASKHHPDKGGNENKFKEIQEAYDRVSHPEKYKEEHPGWNRQHYSTSDWHTGNASPHFSFEDLLRRSQQQHNVLRLQLQISIESTLHEQKRTIHVPEHNIPPTEITIPAGIRNGESINYSDLPSMQTKYNNSTLVVIFVYEAHNEYQIAEHVHLLKQVKVNALDAMIGTTLQVSTIDNTTLKIKLAPGTQNGTKLKISEKGLKYRGNPNLRGDMYVDVVITIPTLTVEETDIITNLRKKQYE